MDMPSFLFFSTATVTINSTILPLLFPDMRPAREDRGMRRDVCLLSPPSSSHPLPSFISPLNETV